MIRRSAGTLGDQKVIRDQGDQKASGDPSDQSAVKQFNCNPRINNNWKRQQMDCKINYLNPRILSFVDIPLPVNNVL